MHPPFNSDAKKRSETAGCWRYVQPARTSPEVTLLPYRSLKETDLLAKKTSYIQIAWLARTVGCKEIERRACTQAFVS